MFEAAPATPVWELKKQVLFISQKDKGVVNDLVSEGLLRNIVRHCMLMQEIYDSNLEGNIPRECAKINCEDKRLGWFESQKDQKNFEDYKKAYCDKSITYIKTEEKFMNDLRDKNGAKICNKSLNEFFN